MSKHYETKQVILMRTDLRNTQGQKVRSGKLCAQAAHASMMFITKRLEITDFFGDGRGNFSCEVDGGITVDEREWLKGSFAKIVLGVTLDELTVLAEAARRAGLQSHVCVDNGATEFGGVPTVTCAAIGPATSDVIDKITGHLRPL